MTKSLFFCQSFNNLKIAAHKLNHGTTISYTGQDKCKKITKLKLPIMTVLLGLCSLWVLSPASNEANMLSVSRFNPIHVIKRVTAPPTVVQSQPPVHIAACDPHLALRLAR